MTREQARRRRKDAENSTEADIGRRFRFAVCLLIALCAAAGVSRLLDPHALPIKEVRIEGEFRHLSPEALEKIVIDSVNAGFFLLNVDAVRAALLEQAWINDVSVRRIWPDTVQVTVLEQRAVAIWCDSELLNDSGVIFAPDPDSFPPDLVRLYGPPGSQAEVLARYKAMREFLHDYAIDFQQLTLSDRRAWSLQLTNGPTVIIGRRDVDNRIEHFRFLLARGLETNLNGVETVDLRYTNGVAVRFREADA